MWSADEREAFKRACAVYYARMAEGECFDDAMAAAQREFQKLIAAFDYQAEKSESATDQKRA